MKICWWYIKSLRVKFPSLILFFTSWISSNSFSPGNTFMTLIPLYFFLLSTLSLSQNFSLSPAHFHFQKHACQWCEKWKINVYQTAAVQSQEEEKQLRDDDEMEENVKGKEKLNFVFRLGEKKRKSWSLFFSVLKTENVHKERKY